MFEEDMKIRLEERLKREPWVNMAIDGIQYSEFVMDIYQQELITYKIEKRMEKECLI